MHHQHRHHGYCPAVVRRKITSRLYTARFPQRLTATVRLVSAPESQDLQTVLAPDYCVTIENWRSTTASKFFDIAGPQWARIVTRLANCRADHTARIVTSTGLDSVHYHGTSTPCCFRLCAVGVARTPAPDPAVTEPSDESRSGTHRQWPVAQLTAFMTHLCRADRALGIFSSAYALVAEDADRRWLILPTFAEPR